MKTTWTGMNIPIVNGFLNHSMVIMIGAMIVGIVNKTHLKVSWIGGITARNMLLKCGPVRMISFKDQTMNSLQIILITKRVEGQMAVMVEVTTAIVLSATMKSVMRLDPTVMMGGLICMTQNTVEQNQHIIV